MRRILILDQMAAAMMESSGEAGEYVSELYKMRELVKYAVIVVASLPVMVLYPFLQKYFAHGVMIGSVKG